MPSLQPASRYLTVGYERKITKDTLGRCVAPPDEGVFEA